MTITEEIPRLLVKAWYPWNAMSGMPYYITLVFQVSLTHFSCLQTAKKVENLFVLRPVADLDFVSVFSLWV
jgi:hypothetical protein